MRPKVLTSAALFFSMASDSPPRSLATRAVSNACSFPRRLSTPDASVREGRVRQAPVVVDDLQLGENDAADLFFGQTEMIGCWHAACLL